MSISRAFRVIALLKCPHPYLVKNVPSVLVSRAFRPGIPRIRASGTGIQHTDAFRGGKMISSCTFRTATFAAAALLVAAPSIKASGGEGPRKMATRSIYVQRVSVISSRPFAEVVAAVEARVGHPDMAAFRKAVTAAQDEAQLKKAVQGALGPSGFMEFARYDLGEVVQKTSTQKTPRVLRLVIGNPLIMKEMVKDVPDAGSYAPVTILIDEREDGVHLSYDAMATYLAPYGNKQALSVARELDSKVEALLTAAARAKN